VNLVVARNGSKRKIPQVPDAAACGDDPAWYYDDPNDPSTLSLCPAFCSELQMDESAEIDLEFGCETLTPQ
jgi:hypothetical protein